MLKEIIAERPVILCLGGKSIEELENHIQDLKDKAICWMGLNLYQPAESILQKIDRRMQLLFDSSSDQFADDYLRTVKMPRLVNFLSRPENNLFITSHGVVRDDFSRFPGIYATYKHKILEIDSLFPEPVKDWMDVPNSATLAIAAAYAGGASKVVLLGCDGMGRKLGTYYKPELHAVERIGALGNAEDTRINSDANRFENQIVTLVHRYQTQFNNHVPIFNCSPITQHKALPILAYENLKYL